jgi:glycosyltransferase involved in cell wall biosynthesis
MKLAFVIKTLDSRGGGAERVLTQVTSELVKRGHQISLLTFGAPGEPDFYPVDPAIERIWLGAGNVQTPSGVIDVLSRIKKLRRAIRDVGPDAAIGFMHSSYIPLAIALPGSSIPVVASEHTSFDHFRRLPLHAFLLRAAAPFFARMTIISEALRNDFPRHAAERMAVIPNPLIPLSARADPIGGRQKILLHVGRLSEEKDQRTLIEAFAQVAPAHPEWMLRIVGQGALRGELEAIITALGIEDRVELAGVTGDIGSTYASAQLFAMPSRYESFGLATAEALAAAIPAIGFADCAGTNELIRNGVNGLLVEGPDRVSALADGLDLLMSSPKLRQQMSAAAPASVEMFKLEAIVDQWEALLETIVGTMRKGSPNQKDAAGRSGTEPNRVRRRRS